MFNRAFPTALALLVAACSDNLPTGIKPSSTPAAIAMQSGDGQSAVVFRSLANPLLARVTDARGRPVRNASVWFEIVSGGGDIVGRSSMLTDSSGLASAIWRLGTSTAAEQLARANVLTSSGAPSALSVTFHATSLPDVAWSVEIPAPGGAIELVSDFTRTVVARAYDSFRNPVPGATVYWSAPMAGTLGADETVTGPDGSTENQWTVRAISRSNVGAGAYWIAATIRHSGLPDGSTALYSVTVGDARLTATSLAAGARHSCAVADAGQVYCWGENTSGQLGDGARLSRPYAVRVEAGAESFTQVVAGLAHTCALTTAGKAYCWGANSEGQLGDGTRALRSTPAAVDHGGTFVSLTAGSSHTCGLTDAGAAYCWGTNLDGQLGDGLTTGIRMVPNKVPGEDRFASLTAGTSHTCGLTTDERTLCWGNDDAGQLGTAAIDDICRARCVTTPSLVSGRFIALSAGMQYTCGVDRDGTTWCWGGNLASRARVASDAPFTDLVGGRASDACGITGEGRAYCWTFYYHDYYYYDGGTAELTSPQRIGGARMFSALRLGDSHACALERGDVAWVVCWSSLTSNTLTQSEPTHVVRAGRP